MFLWITIMYSLPRTALSELELELELIFLFTCFSMKFILFQSIMIMYSYILNMQFVIIFFLSTGFTERAHFVFFYQLWFLKKDQRNLWSLFLSFISSHSFCSKHKVSFFISQFTRVWLKELLSCCFSEARGKQTAQLINLGHPIWVSKDEV